MGEVRTLATDETFLAGYKLRRSRKHYEREALAFRVASENYAVDMGRMREILKLRAATEVPRAPRFLLGVIALRGTLITVIDLRLRLGLAAAPLVRTGRVLVVEHEGEPYGLVVDEVFKVLRMRDEQVESAPLPSGISSVFLAGVARVAGELIALLDVPAVVSFDVLDRKGGR